MQDFKIFNLKLSSCQTHILFIFVLIALMILRCIGMITLNLPLYGDEAQYWTWSNELALGYYSKPPLLAWVIHFFTNFFGDTPTAIRLSSLLSYPITVIAIYCLAGQMFGQTIAFWSGILFLVAPGVTFSSLISSTDPLFFTCWAWGLLSFWNALKSNKLRWWIFTGIFVGVGLLSKYAMLGFIGSMVLVVLLDPDGKVQRSNWKFWIAIGIGFAILSPNIYWNIANHFVSFKHTVDNANLHGDYFKFTYILKFIGGQLAIFGLIHFPVLLYLYCVNPKQIWNESNSRFLFLFSAPVLLFFFIKAFMTGGHANWSAPAYISGSIIVTWWCFKTTIWQRILKVVIIVHMLLMLVFYQYEPLLDILNIPRTKNTDPLARYKKWDEIAFEIKKIIQARDLKSVTIAADDRMIIAVLKYYLRHDALPIAKWNPKHFVKDHYDLTTTLEGQNILVISAKLSLDDISPYGDVQYLEDIIVNPAHNFYRVYKVYLIRNFKGY